MRITKGYMTMRILSLIILITSSYVWAHNESGVSTISKNWQMIASFKSENMMKDFKKLSSLDIDIAGVDHSAKIIDVLISAIDYKVLEKKGFDLTVVQTKGVSFAPDTEYQNPDEIEKFVHEVHEKYPSITKLISIGKSLEGRDIWAIKISDNASEKELEEPALLFNSMHHAREVMTPEMGLDIVNTLTQNYGADQKITHWVDSNEIWVIPMFNVDGNNKMWNEDSWWRKNTRGGYGVDLNRNYPTGWNKCNGSSGRRTSQTYRGESPASEPETRAMMNFIENTRPVFDISYHSYSELVIYPFGCRGERTATKEVVEKIGKKIAKLLDYKPGTAWELLYNADGGDIDWMYDAYQVIPYVIELNSRRQGFHPDYHRWRDVTVERNKAGWQYLLERVEQSGIRGQLVKEAKAISDFTVSVYKIVNGTPSKFQTYVGHKTGMFHIVLNPGKYKLTFTGSDFTKSVEYVVGDDLLVTTIEL